MILAFLPAQTAEILEIIATVTFVIYLVLQILHSRYMWYLYIPSCICAAINFFNSATWAFAALNLYYIAMGFVGIINWRKDNDAQVEGSTIPLHKLGWKTLNVSIVICIAGIPALYFLLRWLDDPNPLLDSITTVLSVVGTWWLTRSYIVQWFVWITADIFAIWMNVNLGNKWFVLQFVLCIVSSVIGLIHWHRKGEYVDAEVRGPEYTLKKGKKAS